MLVFLDTARSYRMCFLIFFDSAKRNVSFLYRPTGKLLDQPLLGEETPAARIEILLNIARGSR
jgi:hypothetical protein